MPGLGVPPWTGPGGGWQRGRYAFSVHTGALSCFPVFSAFSWCFSASKYKSCTLLPLTPQRDTTDIYSTLQITIPNTMELVAKTSFHYTVVFHIKVSFKSQNMSPQSWYILWSLKLKNFTVLEVTLCNNILKIFLANTTFCNRTSLCG